MTTKPFARLQALYALVAAAMQNVELKAAGPVAMRQQQNAILATYASRGHGGKRAYTPTGISAARRACRKAKGIAQNRRNHKGSSKLLAIVLCIPLSGCLSIGYQMGLRDAYRAQIIAAEQAKAARAASGVEK